MDCTTLELNIVSAKDLKDVNLFSKMYVYVVVSISGDPHCIQTQKTTVDSDGGNNPTWNFPMKFTVPTSPDNPLFLIFTLFSDRTLGDKPIGQVQVPLTELLNTNTQNKPLYTLTHRQVIIPSGKPEGDLNFSFKFSNTVAAQHEVDESVTAYPTPLAGPVVDSGPSPQHSPVQQPAKKSKFGLGWFRGAVAGLFGSDTAYYDAECGDIGGS